MKYSEAYQQTRDIDWFFRTHNRCIHVASNGGRLPDFVNDVRRLRQEQAMVSMLKAAENREFFINNNYVNERLSANEAQKQLLIDYDVKAAYLSTFLDMARKGFYSYDKSLEDDSTYVLICGPCGERHPIECVQLLEANDEIEFKGDDIYSFIVKPNYIEERTTSKKELSDDRRSE